MIGVLLELRYVLRLCSEFMEQRETISLALFVGIFAVASSVVHDTPCALFEFLDVVSRAPWHVAIPCADGQAVHFVGVEIPAIDSSGVCERLDAGQKIVQVAISSGDDARRILDDCLACGMEFHFRSFL